MEDEADEPLARLAREGRRRVEDAADLRRVDPQQAYAAERRHVDRVAVNHRTNEHRFGETGRRIGGRNGSRRQRCDKQKVHHTL